MTSRAIVAPLVLVATVAAMLGFLVHRTLTQAPHVETVGVSVIALPSTPKPTPEPSPTAEADVRINGRSRGGSTDDAPSDGDVSNCPAGCECETRPPAGVVIVCR